MRPPCAGCAAASAGRRHPDDRPRAGRRRASATDRGPRAGRTATAASVTSPSAKTPMVWVDGHDRAERDRVPRRAARADEVAGDHRLAVAGRERVERAPAERCEQQQDSTPWPRRRRRRGRRSRPPAVLDRLGRPPARGAVTVPSPGFTSKLAVAPVERALEQVGGIDGQPLRRVAARRVERTAVPAPGWITTARQPIRPGKVPSCSSTFRGPSDPRDEVELEARGLKAALARPEARARAPPRARARPDRRRRSGRRRSSTSARLAAITSPRCSRRALWKVGISAWSSR